MNCLFKIYFKLNTLHLCKNLINAVNLPTFLPFNSFPIGQRVTYSFYVGRLSVFDDDYKSAETHLTYAFEHCRRGSIRNKRLVLQYLVPVKLILGVLPKVFLLEKYGLREYRAVVEAVQSGNVRQLNDALEKSQGEFIRQGTYLILEKLRAVVHRTLFKKVHLIQTEKQPQKANQVPLSLLRTALAWCGSDMDIDEVECVVANLIYRRFIKGYISHKSRVVVLSKTDAFPVLSSAFLHDP